MTLNQGITGSVFGVCEGNAAVAHGDRLSQFNLEGFSVFYDTDVIGRREFAGSTENIEGFPIFLGEGSRISCIVTGELQVNILNGCIHFTLRRNVTDFKGCIIVAGKGQLIVFKFPFFNIDILQAVNRNFAAILHG